MNSSIGIKRLALTAAALTAAGTLAATSFASDASTGHPAASRAVAKATQGEVAFVQAVPNAQLTVTVDGTQVKSGVAEGSVVGPLAMAPGTHEVVFTDGSTSISSTVDVSSGKTSDVVVHRPAAVGGQPIVSVYPIPTGAVGPDKARVLVAHTATTAPADVQVDGKTVFSNIANGEYAEADLPAGTHMVALYPAGVTSNPILGPLKVDLKPGTFTSIYAVGNPKQDSMNVITRITQLAASGTSAPSAIDTGSAGLVGDVLVHTFTGK